MVQAEFKQIWGCLELRSHEAVAHNPTGVDPTPDQWQKIVAACKARTLECKGCKAL